MVQDAWATQGFFLDLTGLPERRLEFPSVLCPPMSLGVTDAECTLVG